MPLGSTIAIIVSITLTLAVTIYLVLFRGSKKSGDTSEEGRRKGNLNG